MTPSPQEPVSVSPYSRPFVLSMIALTIVLFLGAAGLIAYRWLVTNDPSALLIVDASAPLQGAKVSVRSVDESKPQVVTIGEGNRFNIPFFLDPGTYSLEIILNDNKIYRGEFTLHHDEVGRIDLSHWEPPPATRPSL